LAAAHLDSPPAVLLGETGSAVSLARSLGRVGVPVYVLGSDGSSLPAASRYCTAFVELGGGEGVTQRWLDWLEQDGPSGAVLLPPGDEGLELIVRHSERLEELGYRLPETAGEVSLAMLDKTRTYELARKVGIPCPHTWQVRSEADAVRIGREVPFPCALKPVHSHLFAKHFPVKVLLARDGDELLGGIRRTRELGLEMLVTEIIPGPDHLIWNHRTYIDERGEALFSLTTNRLRSLPIHFGTNCYLVTRWHPEAAETGLRFVREVGLRGLAHTELKRDPRDGQFKLIECNHRFVNVQEVVRRAGLDVALFVYRRALGQQTPPMDSWREDVHLWFPLRDWRAARDYRRKRELTWPGWLRSLARRRVYTPVLALDDPRPTFANVWHKLSRRFLRLLSSMR
jgi:D-aspartate ligase